MKLVRVGNPRAEKPGLKKPDPMRAANWIRSIAKLQKSHVLGRTALCKCSPGQQ